MTTSENNFKEIKDLKKKNRMIIKRKYIKEFNTIEKTIEDALYSDITNEELAGLKEQFSELVKKENSYTLSDVINHPIKYSSGGFTEASNDIDFRFLIKGSNKRKNILFITGVLASFGAITAPHELIHAYTNNLLGNDNKEIVINTLYGGSLWHRIIPEIQSRWLFPLLGGYVDKGEISKLENIAVDIAPYIMTPIGIYLVSKGRGNKSLAYYIAGAGLVSVHAGGIIGDFYSIGKSVIEYVCNPFMPSTVVSFSENLRDFIGTSLIFVGGFLLGSKALSMTYSLSKGMVNSIRNYIK